MSEKLGQKPPNKQTNKTQNYLPTNVYIELDKNICGKNFSCEFGCGFCSFTLFTVAMNTDVAWNPAEVDNFILFTSIIITAQHIQDVRTGDQ